MRGNAVMSSHVRFALLPILLLASMPLPAGTVSDLAKAVRENTLDRDECYRVRDLTLVKDDLRIYLTDGYMIFGKPVAGRRVAAVFTSQVENGDAEVILRPPNLAERRSLASLYRGPQSGRPLPRGGFPVYRRRLSGADGPDPQ